MASIERDIRANRPAAALDRLHTYCMKKFGHFFDKFNHVRNNQSLAHDNELLDPAEAWFIYDSITAILRFVKTIEANKFDAAPTTSPQAFNDEIPF